MKQSGLFALWLGAVVLAGGLAGCTTTSPSPNKNMASVEIAGRTMVEIFETTEQVFREASYTKAPGFVFERKGSAWDNFSYGGWSGNAVWVRIRLTLDPRGSNAWYLDGDVYMVRDRGDVSMEEEQKPWVSKRGECQKLLNQIKARLSAPSPRSGS